VQSPEFKLLYCERKKEREGGRKEGRKRKEERKEGRKERKLGFVLLEVSGRYYTLALI
jgi:hypothetical protein